MRGGGALRPWWNYWWRPGRAKFAREYADGTLIDEDLTQRGAHIEIEAPIDPRVHMFLLVEAAGYEDWEKSWVVTEMGSSRELLWLIPSQSPKPIPDVQG